MALQSLRRRRIPQAPGAPTFPAPDQMQRPAQMPTGSTTTGPAPEGPPQQGGGGGLLGMGMMGMQANNMIQGPEAGVTGYTNAAGQGGYQYGPGQLAPQSAAYNGSTLSGAGRVAAPGETLSSTPAMGSPSITVTSPNAYGGMVNAGQVYGNKVYSPYVASQMNAEAAATALPEMVGPEAAFSGSELFGPGMAEMGGAEGLSAAGSVAPEVAAPAMAPAAEAAAAEAGALAAEGSANGALLGMGPWGWAAAAGIGLLATDPFGWFD